MIGTDVYRCWRATLKSEPVNDDMLLPTGLGGVDRHPQPGIWKRKEGGGYVDGQKTEHRWVPVKIWLEDESGIVQHKWDEGLTLKALVGKDKQYNPLDIWSWCSSRDKTGKVLTYNAVTQADYKHWLEHGYFPGELPPNEDTAPAGIGHNSAAEDEDSFASLTREIEAERQRVSAWLEEPHEGKTAADMASNWLDALRKLEKRATDAHGEEKAPHLAAGKAVDDKWRPIRLVMEGVKKRMADAYSEIARKEKARLQAIADAEAAKKAAEFKKQQDAERKRMEALAAENNVHLEPEPVAPAPVVVAAPVKVSFGGARGSKIGLKEYKVALVTDWTAATMHYSKSDKVREIIQKLANADAKNGVEVPGVKIVVEERV